MQSDARFIPTPKCNHLALPESAHRGSVPTKVLHHFLVHVLQVLEADLGLGGEDGQLLLFVDSTPHEDCSLLNHEGKALESPVYFALWGGHQLVGFTWPEILLLHLGQRLQR